MKNLNDSRSVARAIEDKVARQVIVLETGGGVENDLGLEKTLTMRDKEAKQDYTFLLSECVLITLSRRT